jgi:hypothetical protein
MAAQRFVKRLEDRRTDPGLAGQCRQAEFDALAGVALALAIERPASRARESDPRALTEPFVSLSAHTAPSVRPRP